MQTLIKQLGIDEEGEESDVLLRVPHFAQFLSWIMLTGEHLYLYNINLNTKFQI